MPNISGLAVITVLVSGCLANPQCYVDNKVLNKALGATTFASSHTSSRPISLTVNGNCAEYDANCMDTLNIENPWLVVDLNDRLPVSTIVFTAITRNGATIKYRILVGNTFDADTFNPLTSGYEPCIPRPVSMVPFETMYVQCERTLVGRYVLVYRQEVSNLRVCELEVYAEQVFQPEKWTCIKPELQGPLGQLNLGKGRGSNSYQISVGWNGDSYKALDGDDETVYEAAGYPCTHTSTHSKSWWLVNLGQTAIITGVAITNRLNCCPERLNNFKIYVRNLAAAAMSFVESDYEVCVHYCTVPSPRRKYYTCENPIEGNHVAVALVGTGILTLCEVEIYADINDVTLPSIGFSSQLNQRALYDNSDTTCIHLHKMMGWKPFTLQIPWDPTEKTGIKPHVGYYHCRQHFYINITYTTSLYLSVSISNEQVPTTASGEYIYVGRSSEVIGKMEDGGLTRIRYKGFCEVKCWVFIYVKHSPGMDTSDSRVCTINVYD